MEFSLYDTLRHLPLFQGMSQSALMMVLEKVKFHFLKFEDKDIIFHQGDTCDKLVFIIGGTLIAQTCDSNGLFTLEETMQRPSLLEPHSLFGKRTTFKSTYIAQGTVSLISIEKQYIYTELNCHMVFRMNLFNQLSLVASHQHEKIWDIKPRGLEGRLIYFISSLCTTPYGRKTLRIRMEDLARLLDNTRLNVSDILNKWQKEGLIEMHRKEFVFLDLERLANA